MENKIFEFMTKMYSDLATRLDSMDKRFDGIDNDLKALGNQLTVIKYEVKNDIKVLYDGYIQTYEKVV